jgi:predicted secreted protein
MPVRKYQKDTTRIRARIGESFVLELPSRATSGYVWRLTRAPEVAALREERVRPAGAGLGAAWKQEFEFVATAAGEGALVLQYKRSWEAAAREELAVTIAVEP